MHPQNAPSPDPTGHRTPDEVNPVSVANGYEGRDVSLRGLALFGAGLAGFLVVVLTLLFGVFRLFDRREDFDHVREARREPGSRALAREPVVPAGPLLQVDPGVDLTMTRTDNARELETYGWVDRPAGVVRLPIERAMDLLVQRGPPPVPAVPRSQLDMMQEHVPPQNRPPLTGDNRNDPQRFPPQ